MKHLLTYGLLCCFFFLIIGVKAADPVRGSRDFWLFADRTWALSGDTVWFSVVNVVPSELQGNVVHVELDNISNEPISHVMVVTRGGSGSGYLVVPDSLSGGIYRLRAFANLKPVGPGGKTVSLGLTVYNRFDENVTALYLPTDWIPLETTEIMPVGVEAVKRMAGQRDAIEVSITLPEEKRNEIREMFVSASLAEPETCLSSGNYFFQQENGQVESRGDFPAETDGFFITGRIVAAPGDTLPPRSMALLSIPDSIPHFDYCFTDRDGNFRFKLKKAFGTATIYLRAIVAEGQEVTILLTNSRSDEKSSNIGSNYNLSEKQQQFVKEMQEADWYRRIFEPERTMERPVFSLAPRFGNPFYGKADHRVFPAEFVHLPDFREISRELLPAVKFRIREGSSSVQILDKPDNKYFEQSPLRLINGIPIFDDNLLYRFRSSDIQYIDLLYQERIFDDISFKGVIAIRLKEGNDDWLTDQKNLFRFTIPCLQMPKAPGYQDYKETGKDANLPDFRRVFLFKRLDALENQKVSFSVSDLKGSVIIRVTGVTINNEPFEITRKIQVL